MKIVLFDYVFRPDKPGKSGLSDLVWNWAQHLALSDEVHLVGPYPAGTVPPRGTILHRFAVPPIGYRNILGHLLIVLRGWQEVRKLGRADVIHAPEYLSTGLFSLLSRRTPVVLTVPGNIYEHIHRNANPYDWSATQAFKWTARLSARRCARIIATSNDMKRWWEYTGAPPSRIAVIPLGVDLTTFRHVAGARARLRISRDSRVILYAGRLDFKEKGLDKLLNAVAALRVDFPGIELHLAGSGKGREQIERAARQLRSDDIVFFHDWIPQAELPAYYSAADVTVLPSLTEGFPRVALEAMACRSPFLASRVSGIVDFVKDRENGFLVDPGDERQLKDKLDHVLRNRSLAVEAAERGCDYVQQHLAWPVIVRRIREEVYGGLGGFA